MNQSREGPDDKIVPVYCALHILRHLKVCNQLVQVRGGSNVNYM